MKIKYIDRLHDVKHLNIDMYKTFVQKIDI